MTFIDKTIPSTKFDVTTVDVRNGVGYMGPTVRVNARDQWHAKEVVEKMGYTYNPHFPPEEVRER